MKPDRNNGNLLLAMSHPPTHNRTSPPVAPLQSNMTAHEEKITRLRPCIWWRRVDGDGVREHEGER